MKLNHELIESKPLIVVKNLWCSIESKFLNRTSNSANMKVAQFFREHISFNYWYLKFWGLNPQKPSQSSTEQCDRTIKICNFKQVYLQIYWKFGRSTFVNVGWLFAPQLLFWVILKFSSSFHCLIQSNRATQKNFCASARSGGNVALLTFSAFPLDRRTFNRTPMTMGPGSRDGTLPSPG
jgi:hypothetical protein